MKPIRLSAHARDYIDKRGFSVEEVKEAIRMSPWEPAGKASNRHECSKEFPFHGDWNGKWYAAKRVRFVFVDERLEIVVITVYTYYY